MASPKALDGVIARLGDNASPQVIRAYHGSPYDFDRFDASKIGTGEGAQAYGYGLYFAGNEGVARSYRDMTPALLPPEAQKLHQQVKHLFKRHADLTGELHAAADTEGTFAVGWGNIKDPPEAARARILPQLEAVNQQLTDVQNRLHAVLHGRRGHMYEVELGFPEEALLDYDRPFATPAGVVGAEILRQDNPAAVSASALRAIQDGSWRMESFVGRSPYETAAVELTRLAKTRGGAQALMDAGVPGVRYLDGQSRTAGKGTRNYVVFPGAEDQIRILRKFAVPGMVGAGAAMSGGE